MMKLVSSSAIMLLLALLVSSQAVEDGKGTNYVAKLKATSIELNGVSRTQWPGLTQTTGGGTWNFRVNGETIFWTPIIPSAGTLQSVLVQTDTGNADVIIVRSHWQDNWQTYVQLATFTATDSGTSNSSWSSTWVSNGYRLGIAVTNYTTGTNLWWSIEYTQ